MRQILLFSILLKLVLFLSCNCNGDNSEKSRQETSGTNVPAPKDIFEKRVILVVDVSSSITEDSKLLAARYAGQITKELADDSHLLIYTTEKNSAQQAIVDIKKIIPLKPTEKADFETRIWPGIVKSTYDIVLTKGKKGGSTSCILDGVKSVRAGLANASKAKETYLLIISDMLEDCELGSPKTAKDFVMMKKKLEKSDLRDFQLASKIPQDQMKICFINQNAKPGNANMIASPEFRAFWQQAFKMLGYSEMPAPGTSIDAFLDLIGE